MPLRGGVEGCPGWKVIWTTTDDLGRTWWAQCFLYESDVMDFAHLKDNREGELDVIVEEGWYPEPDWNDGRHPIKAVIWNEEDLAPGEPKVWVRK